MNQALVPALLLAFLSSSLIAADRALPASDQRGGKVKTLDTRWAFPEIASRAQWEARAREIREHILVSCGLWPMPEKSPLDARIFDRLERDGYTIEKVHFQPLPGFYLAGNLYRPSGKGSGPFPAILNPHGHWRKGRLEDQALGSIAARCINFAKQGMIAFSYDMVGYNDTAQVPHTFASDPTNLLWNISLMGLQTWNSIRALDFLESLPDVDASRLACTGESGGGTQTFMLGAIDPRLAAQAPIVMVSHSMQGGCLCENAPGLRLDHSNMEIAATAAPRPQLLVAATGDWTRATMEMEGPAIEKIYGLFGAPEKFRYAIFDYDHNYNRTSREAVYEFFGGHLLKGQNRSDWKETPYQKEPDETLRVWHKPPPDALTEPQLIARLRERHEAQLEALGPRDKQSLQKFRTEMTKAWRHTLAVEIPEKGLSVAPGGNRKTDAWTMADLTIGRANRGDRVPITLINPIRDDFTWIVVLIAPEGRTRFLNAAREPIGLAEEFVKARYSVVLADPFRGSTNRNHLSKYFSTYNRTDLQEQVQDIITTCAFAQTHGKGRRVLLVGAGDAGLWCLLAAPAAQAVVADYGNFTGEDARLMKADLFVPGLRRIGAFEGAAALAAPNPALVHNTGEHFKTQWLETAYAAAKSTDALRINHEAMDDAQIVKWVSGLKAGRRL